MKDTLDFPFSPFAMFMLFLLVMSNVVATYSQAYEIEIPRNKTLWVYGYLQYLSSFNPLLMDGDHQGWDTYIMYEPMFGTNAANGELINWLGEDIRWANSTTIEVVLRDGIYWVKMTPSGPVYERPITSEDAQYSYLLYGAFDESPDFCDYMASFRDRVGSISNFEIVNDRVFRVHIKPEYANSSVVWRSLTRSFLILPKHVWTEIVANFSNVLLFKNDWMEPAMPTEWKVASGMYLPYYYRNGVPSHTIIKRNENWWGINVFGKEPAPEYIGFITDYGSMLPWECLEMGELDWCRLFIPWLDETMEKNPNIHTYLSNQPYFADDKAKLMVPNHRKWPIGQPWLNKAITSVLNYTTFSELALCGFLKAPSPLLIPADDAVARELLNITIEEKYRVPCDPTGAYGKALLDQYCFVGPDGRWYTDDGPSQDYFALYPDHFTIEDALPDYPGINVPLGPWTLLDWAGWTDVNSIDLIACSAITNALNVDITPLWRMWEVTDIMNENTYDFVHYVMNKGFNSDMYERYTELFTGPAGASRHYGDYRNVQLTALISSLETAPAGSAEQQNIANQIQEIVGSNLPIIPMAGNPEWYIYYDKYWVGWPNQNNPLLPCSAYTSSAQDANLHALLLGLRIRTPDLNGDGVVDILDITLAATAFGAVPRDDRWNSIADVNGDRVIDIVDLTTIAIHFGETFQY